VEIVPRALTPAAIALLVVAAACSSSTTASSPDGSVAGAGDSGARGRSVRDAADARPTSCNETVVNITVVDYFTGAAVADTLVTVDGAPATSPFCLGSGVHPVTIQASGYATYNGAIQLPGGATSRSVPLFPVTTSAAAWLALANTDREANGAPAVQLDDGLMIAAWDHAVDMGVQGYFAHFDPHGFAPTTRSLMLGSMLMGSEDIAAGVPTYEQADAEFMAEQAKLPNQAASDCATSDSLAPHFCNIVAATHNRLGVGIVDVPGSPYKTYYDQEFGDLYGYYDTTVLPPEPPLDAGAPVTLLPAPGYPFKYEQVEMMAAPTPIGIATLNADIGCASMCPAGDVWYPTGNMAVSSNGPLPYTPTLSASQIVFVALETNAMPFLGASAYAAFWGGGTAKPDSYGASSKSYLVP
jgi:uncharacterized protein YkwD